MSITDSPPEVGSRAVRRRSSDRGMNRVFRWLAVGAGVTILAALAAVALFLVGQAWPA